MRLREPYLKLPVTFNAERLASEALQFRRMYWKPDRFSVDGYWSLNLVSYQGRSTEFQGTPMEATAALQRCPYTMQVLAFLGGGWSEVRFRLLEGNCSIPEHFDANHFWFERLRLHIPVTTDSCVRFLVDNDVLPMQAGECWIFDRQRPHRVVNESSSERIHLVMDTLGSRQIGGLLRTARQPLAAPAAYRFDGSEGPAAVFTDRSPTPVVLPPSALELFFDDLMDRVGLLVPTEGRRSLQCLLDETLHIWAGIWAQHGPKDTGWRQYRDVLQRLLENALQLTGDYPGAFGEEGGRLVQRLTTFAVSGALAVFHAAPSRRPELDRAGFGAHRVQFSEDILLRLEQGAFIRIDGVETSFTAEEVLLLVAVVLGKPFVEATRFAGVEQTEEEFSDFVEEAVRSSRIRISHREWLSQTSPTQRNVSSVLPPAATNAPPTHLDHLVALELVGDVVIRVRETGEIAVWAHNTGRYHVLEPIALSVLCAIRGSRTLENVLAEARVHRDRDVDAMLLSLEILGIVRLIGVNGEDPGQ